MKKALVIAGSILMLQACGSNSGDKGGAVNDGTKDTVNQVIRPDTKSTDSSYTNHPANPDSNKMRDREDVQKRK
ncbi:MAG: hypothetical protein ACJ748_05510 [Flavisolibacter sp.]|jgi:protein involved in sex pheromone biosynthesis